MIDYDDVINKHRERLLKPQDQGASKEGENEGDSQQTEDTGEEGAENPEENSIRLPQIHKTTKVIKPGQPQCRFPLALVSYSRLINYKQ